MKRRSRWLKDLPDSKALLAQLLTTRIRYRGVEMLHEGPKGFMLIGGNQYFSTKQQALAHWIVTHPRTYGNYILTRQGERRLEPNRFGWYNQTPIWRLTDHSKNTVAVWAVRPLRQDIAAAIREARKTDSRPSFRRPDTLGWRSWPWDSRRHCLVSPHTGHPWLDPELRVDNWSSAAAVRGHAGIHACRLPRGDWRLARKPADMPFTAGYVLGLVERFGKFVLGTEGWRAEWVFIKELLAPDEATARQIRRAYPDVPVTVAPKGHWMRG